MMRDFKVYPVQVFIDVPSYICEGLLGVVVVGTIALIWIKGIKMGWRWCMGLILAGYLFLIFYSTVISRVTGSETEYNLMPFWSYRAYFCGENSQLLVENVMNVVAFVPVGLLLGAGFRSMVWRKVLLIGGGMSVSIEAMQFFLMRGFSEVDDVMHNTVGCVMGYGIYLLVRKGHEKLCK